LKRINPYAYPPFRVDLIFELLSEVSLFHFGNFNFRSFGSFGDFNFGDLGFYNFLSSALAFAGAIAVASAFTFAIAGAGAVAAAGQGSKDLLAPCDDLLTVGSYNIYSTGNSSQGYNDLSN
jgi:hypothetical protein